MKLIIASFLLAVAAADRLDNTYLPPRNAPTAGGNGNFLSAPFGRISSSKYLPPGQVTSAKFAPRTSGFGTPSGQTKSHFGASSRTPSAQYGAPTFGGSSRTPSAQYGAPAFGGHSNIPSTQYAAKSAEAGASILRFDNQNQGDGSYRFDYETENKISQQEAGELKQNSQEGTQTVHGSYSYQGDDGKTYTVNYVADENGFQPSGEHLPTPPPIPEAIQKSLAQNAAQGYNGNAQSYAGQSQAFSGHSQAYSGNVQGFQGNTQGFQGNAQGFHGNAFKQGQSQGFAPSKPSFNQKTGYQY